MYKKIIVTFLACAGMSKLFAGVLFLAPTLMYQNTYKSNLRYEEISPKFSLGYGETVHESLYFAGEADAHIGGHRVNNNSQGGNSLKTKYGFGVSLVPGVLLDPYLMAYGRIGLVYTYFDQISATKKGWQAGAGLQMNINPAWDIRAEYDYLQYSRLEEIGSLRADVYSIGGYYRIA